MPELNKPFCPVTLFNPPRIYYVIGDEQSEIAGGINMAKQVLLVAFRGEPMCFVHVLLNALDMKERGYDVKVVIEGTATQAAAWNQPWRLFGPTSS
jgi:hypothetical protein